MNKIAPPTPPAVGLNVVVGEVRSSEDEHGVQHLIPSKRDELREDELHTFAGGLHRHQRQSMNMSFHEATVCVTFDGNASQRKVVIYNLVGLVLVLMQVFVAVAVSIGASAATCSLNRHCFGARVCAHDTSSRGTSCVNCGDGPAARAIAARGYRNQTRPGIGFECPVTDELCAQCYDHAAGSFSNYTYTDEIADNVTAMQHKDWLAMLLCSVILGLRMSSEISCVIRCEILRKRFGCCGQRPHAQLWLWVQLCTGILRRSAVVPVVCSAAYTLIAYRGGDALSICLNTLALSFLFKSDNLLYKYAVSDSERAAAIRSILALDNAAADDAEAGKGHAEADDLEAVIAWVKLASTIFVPVTMLFVLVVSLRAQNFFFHTYDGGNVIFLAYLALPLGESQHKARAAESGRFWSMMRFMGHTMFGFSVATCVHLFL